MTRKRVLVLGAGLSGLSAAWHAQEKGIECIVFEKEAEVGGLCRSKERSGFIFDCCGHLLHFKHPETFGVIKGLCGKDAFLRHERNAWVYSHATYTKYPFQANLCGLPSSVVKECLMGLIEALGKGNQKKNDGLNFSEWIDRHFGKGIAKHFMVPYNRKFWTVPPESLTCEWFDGIMPLVSLRQAIEGTVEENRGTFGYNAQFWYPKKNGIGMLPQALASQVRHVYTNCGVKTIDFRKKRITLASGAKEKFDTLISTIPLPELPGIIEGIPSRIRRQFRKLKWNSIFNLNVGIERISRCEKHWVYFPEKKFNFFRVGFFHNFSTALAPGNKSSLYIEVSYSHARPIEKNRMSGRIIDDLKKIGFLSEGDTICARDINDIRYGYPIYDKEYSSSRKKISAYLLEHHTIPCGRYGSWRYMSMEDALLDGKRASERITG